MRESPHIKTILLIGSGPIVIGQACEFDYSGTQAVKTLKKLGYRVVLINSNPATIMTDPDFADHTYIEPISEEIIADIIKKEGVDAILPTMGGQTALNVAMSMYERGMLEGIEFLGAKPEAIKKGEDRKAFKESMIKIGMDLPKSQYAYNEDEALEAAQSIGFPLIIRASYTLAGGGSGVAYNIDEFKVLAKSGLDASPINEILIEESLLGWKEYEMEVIRDKNDNCIIVCSIENLDPMGVHTGDSITIAPALTLTDKEYQRMRDASFSILREIGVDTGGSNVQFAINPKNGRMTVIEMNPRVSRSSALASKATGYPIAKVATMLAVGYTLDEITNDITGTPASFEPSIDYIVTKIPRFTFEKFPLADSTLTTSMKSIGEVMAIGGTFKESLQKALCSLECGLFGFNRICNDLEMIKKEIRRPNALRLLYIAEGFGLGMNIDSIYELCKIDKWFLNQIREIVEAENLITGEILKNKELMRKIKSYGFSDKNIAYWLKENDDIECSEDEIYATRVKLGVVPQYCEVDTCAAEFPSLTSYLYSSVGDFDSILSSHFLIDNSCGLVDSKDCSYALSQKKHTLNPTSSHNINETPPSILILGSGPNRIGQGIEFDYCCVHSSFALKDLGAKSIMYNCNPETVSTDYDTSDVLYFEPIDFEHVCSVIHKEKPSGIIVHFGGQTPLKLANQLSKLSVNIIGTSAEIIDIAEDREKFAGFIATLGLRQPRCGIAFDKQSAFEVAQSIGYPVLVRPSYVLGGRAMRIVYDGDELGLYVDEVLSVSESTPVLIDKFLQYALELDVDCVCDGESVYIGGIMEHIEEAGIHSGDSASCLPPLHISESMIEEIQHTSAKIALRLGVIGLMNIQFAIFQGELYLIEVNPRASRTVPFVSKATGIPLAKVATRVMFMKCWRLQERDNLSGWTIRENKEDSQNIESTCLHKCRNTLQNNILEEALRFYDKYNIVTKSNIKITENKNSYIFIHKNLAHSSVKESVFPFNKLQGADLLLGPEMKSTGEVMGMGLNFAIAFAKSQLACKNPLPNSPVLQNHMLENLDSKNITKSNINNPKIFISLRNSDKKYAVELARGFSEIGFEIVATGGTHSVISEGGVVCDSVLKVSEGRPHINDMIANKQINMIINTTSNKDKQDARLIRQAVLRANIPYFTTISGAKSALVAMQEITKSKDSKNPVNLAKSLQEYLGRN